MNDESSLPHFLRVARSIARGRGLRWLAAPLAAGAALGVAGACSSDVSTPCGGRGFCGISVMSTSSGAGGSASSTSSGHAVGVVVMSTASSSASSSSSSSSGEGGAAVGLIAMQDAGED